MCSERGNKKNRVFQIVAMKCFFCALRFFSFLYQKIINFKCSLNNQNRNISTYNARS